MKKFLSILLAVMMVLSTVSFAAPSLAGSADTAVEAPVAEVPAVEETPAAELAASTGEAPVHETYGKALYVIDFERADMQGWTGCKDGVDNSSYSDLGAKISEVATYYDPMFEGRDYRSQILSNYPYLDQQTVVDGEGNHYTSGTNTWQWPFVANRNRDNTTGNAGYYTYAFDVMIEAIDNATISPSLAFTGSGVMGVTQVDGWDGVFGKWDTVAGAITLASNGTNLPAGSVAAFNFATAQKSQAKVSFDNVILYYRPLTVDVTLNVNGVDFVATGVSTANSATIASILSAAGVTIPAGTEYVVSATEGGESIGDSINLIEDTTLYVTYEDDGTGEEPEVEVIPAYDDSMYGVKLFTIDFEGKEITSATDEYSLIDIASEYNADKVLASDGWKFKVPSEDFVNHATEAQANNPDNTVLSGTVGWGWAGPVHILRDYNLDAGLYTLVFDLKASQQVGFGITQSGTSFTEVDPYEYTEGKYDHVVLAINEDYLSNKTYIELQLRAAVDMSIDNIKLYWKPAKVNVTVVAGEEEIIVENVSTTGVTAASILEAAGFTTAPYGKKAVLSRTEGGESIGDEIVLPMATTLYLSYADDDAIHPTYGKRLFLVDFDKKFASDGTIAQYTDNYDASVADMTITDWSITPEFKTDNGNNYVEGSHGWAQFLLTYPGYASAPAGRYTLEYKTKRSTVVSGRGISVTGVTICDDFEDTGDWDTFAVYSDNAINTYSTWHNSIGEVKAAFDDIAFYYLPETVNLTVVIDGEEYEVNNLASTGITAASLVDAAGVAVPYGSKAVLSTSLGGEAIDTMNVATDATLYVSFVEAENIHFQYGTPLYIVDFEREDMQTWCGNTATVDNSVVGNETALISDVATYYDEMFEGQTVSIGFWSGLNAAAHTPSVEGDNHYLATTPTWGFPQVRVRNDGGLTTKAGYYTYGYDVKIEGALPDKEFSWGGDTIGLTELDGWGGELGVWDTLMGYHKIEADGTALPHYKAIAAFEYTTNKNNATVSFDNVVLYYKPLTATIKFVANGEVEKTLADIDTATANLVSDLVKDISVEGFAVTGIQIGETTYGLNDTVMFAFDGAVELVLADRHPATPNTVATQNIRVDAPVGVRYKASFAKDQDENITDYGFIVTRETLLGDNELSFDSGVTFVKGYGRENGEDLKEFFNSDDEFNWFTAILYFGQTEEDGLAPVERLCDNLVARPFVKVAGEYIYGDATAPISIFDVCLAVYGEDGDTDEWLALTEEQQNKIMAIMDKCDADYDGVPDHLA